ncbi:MAG: hypothetical protein WC716_07770 [Chitinophagaceae bacterium]
MNENNNRVPGSLPDPLFLSLETILNNFEAALSPYIVGITAEERIMMPKINVDNKDFTLDAINQMRHPIMGQILPAFLKPSDAESDMKMFGQLETLCSRLKNILSQVDNTRMVAGSEAYSTALVTKKLVEAAEASGIRGAEGIAKKLRERFKGQGSSTQSPETPAAPDA